MFVWIKRGFLSLAILGLLFTGVAQAQNGPLVDLGMADEMMPLEPSGVVPGQFIIVFNNDVANVRGAAAEMARAHGLGLQFIYTNAIKGFAATVPEGRLNALERDPRIAYVEADQWGGIETHGVNPVVGIQRIFADDNANIDIDGVDDVRIDVDVAVIDTGIDAAHPDLNVVGSTNCTGSLLSPTCGDGGGGPPHWHGTHVAGTIAALDNGHDVTLNGGTDIVGVAPGARLWAVRVLDRRGAGTVSQYIAGVDWVINKTTIEVANSSLGYPSSLAICDAVERLALAGVTHVVSAGNETSEVFKSPGNCGASVITVSAIADYNGVPGGGAPPNCSLGVDNAGVVDEDDSLADFSNYGPLVDVTAPGVCIASTYPKKAYVWASGTSMSSPHVAGAAALLAASGMTDPAEIKSALKNRGNTNWTDESGDGYHEPLIDVSNSAVFAPATKVVGVSDSPPVASAGPDRAVPDSDSSDGEWVSLDGSGSYDPDGGDIIGYLWTEGATVLGEVASFDVWLADGEHNITLAVTDDENGSASDEVVITVEAVGGGGGDITLTATLQGKVSKRTGKQKIKLNWSGATSTDVDIYRDDPDHISEPLKTTANDGTYTDSVPATGAYTYEVCEAGSTAICSNLASVNFD
ncbi:MAG: S8 family serine peptidase [Proteobacteria bacterium]|nr:S8 family serine peptidase [Pseudomonadota bacterium]